jgi:putative phosphoesterase
MLVVCGDTHGIDSPCLEARTADAIAAAELVIHTGDFTTEAVLSAFRDRSALRAVYGNNDPPAVRDRLPADRVVEWAELRVFAAHGHEYTETALTMTARQANADLVVVGHSHDPGFRDAPIPVCNPGSHAEPRWHRPAHAELEWDATAGLAEGRLVAPDGEVFERFEVAPQPLEE